MTTLAPSFRTCVYVWLTLHPIRVFFFFPQLLFAITFKEEWEMFWRSLTGSHSALSHLLFNVSRWQWRWWEVSSVTSDTKTRCSQQQLLCSPFRSTLENSEKSYMLHHAFWWVCLSACNTSYLNSCWLCFDVTLGTCCVPELPHWPCHIMHVSCLEQCLSDVQCKETLILSCLPSFPLLICAAGCSVWTLPIMLLGLFRH